MNNDKVVQFPKHKIVREAPVDIEALTKAKEKGIQNFADSVTNDIIGFIIGDLENYGIDIETEEFVKDFSLTADSLRATIYRSFDLQHNLHDFIDNNLTVTIRELDGQN